MARPRRFNHIHLIWQKMNYAQKCAVYRFATGSSKHYSERILNIWWSSLSAYERELILDGLMEFLNDK